MDDHVEVKRLHNPLPVPRNPPLPGKDFEFFSFLSFVSFRLQEGVRPSTRPTRKRPVFDVLTLMTVHEIVSFVGRVVDLYPRTVDTHGESERKRKREGKRIEVGR